MIDVLTHSLDTNSFQSGRLDPSQRTGLALKRHGTANPSLNTKTLDSARDRKRNRKESEDKVRISFDCVFEAKGNSSPGVDVSLPDIKCVARDILVMMCN